jgi:hypothetical protein
MTLRDEIPPGLLPFWIVGCLCDSSRFRLVGSLDNGGNLKPITRRRILLVGMVLASAQFLPSCGVTEWQRSQDNIHAALAQADTPEFKRAVEEARK